MLHDLQKNYTTGETKNSTFHLRRKSLKERRHARCISRPFDHTVRKKNVLVREG